MFNKERMANKSWYKSTKKITKILINNLLHGLFTHKIMLSLKRQDTELRNMFDLTDFIYT